MSDTRSASGSPAPNFTALALITATATQLMAKCKAHTNRGAAPAHTPAKKGAAQLHVPCAIAAMLDGVFQRPEGLCPQPVLAAIPEQPGAVCGADDRHRSTRAGADAAFGSAYGEASGPGHPKRRDADHFPGRLVARVRRATPAPLAES